MSVPTQPEYVQWRTRVLAMANPETGQPAITPAQFNDAVGELVDGRDWEEINATWIAWTSTL